MKKGILFVVSAPSGAGKSTIIRIIRPMFPDMLYSISCTTRAPREDEINGKDYYFLTQDKFKEMIANGDFIEWKVVHGNMYGTPAGPVAQAITTGQRMILDIDVEGAKEVFKRFSDAVGIFINAPDFATLEKRLRLRQTDSDESIRTRLTNAHLETEMASIFRYQIINDNLEKAVADLASIIRQESDEKNSLFG
jgi:guanylate kinase